jgi:putative PEP-CTERM system TPR-repeat lipoprotein
LRDLEEIAASDAGTSADRALIGAALRNRRYDTALAASEVLEKKTPDSAVPHAVRGAALLGKNEVAEARKSFERAVELEPNNIAAALSLASIDIAEQKPADARKRFEDILKRDPKNVKALLALAQVTAQQGGTQAEIVALLNRAVAADPTDIAARMAQINYYMLKKEFARAVEAARDADAKIPDRPEIVQALGIAQQANGDHQQAVSTFTKLVQLRPGSAPPLLRLAEAQSRAGDKSGAAATLRKVLATDPNAVQALRGLASLELEAGRLNEALAIAKDLQKRKPADASGYLMEGDIHATRKTWDAAAAAYQAGARKTNASELGVKATMALAASGREAEAKQYASAWLKDHPGDGTYRLFLAERALAQKDYPEALGHYKVLLDKTPDNAALLNNVAWTMAQMKDPKALEFAEKANIVAPGQPRYMDTLGVILVDKGDMTRGVELLRKATALAPQLPNIRLNFAKALVKAGQKDAARKELEVLAKLGSGFPRQAEVTSLLGTL